LLPLIGEVIGSGVELVRRLGLGHAVCMSQMSADGAEYMVVLRSHSGARVRPGSYIDLADFPDGLGDRVQLRVSTRWDDAGLEHPIPRELWMAVRLVAPSMDAAVRSAASAASAIAAIISFCVNAAVEPPDLHVAFDSTAGLSRRGFIEAFVPDESGLPGFGRWIDADSLFAFGQAVYASSEAPRLFRALAQYQVALRYWNTRSRVLVLAHLYIACEALTKAVQRMYQARLGLTEKQHAQLLGVDTTKPKWESLADAFARREYIFGGNRQVYKAAREARNEFEHGTADLGNVRQTADTVTRELFDMVRSAILTLLPTLDQDIAGAIMSKQPVDVSPLYKQVTGHIVSDMPSDPANLGAAGELYPTLRWQSRIQSFRLEDDKLVFQPKETMTVQFAPGLRFEPRDFSIYGGLNPAPPDASTPRPPGWGPDGAARQITPEEGIFEVKKQDLLARVMPLVDAAAASGTGIAQAFPRPLAFNLFGQGVACFQSAQLLITDSRPVEALPSLRGLVTIAARFEQMTREPQALSLVVGIVLNALTEELPGSNANLIRTVTDELLRSAAAARLPVPDAVPPAESTAIWRSLSDEMLLAQSAINGSYLIAGLHVKPGHGANSADFHTRLESGPLTDLIASACVIAQLDLLRHAAPVFGWTIETSTLESLLAEARQLNEASAHAAGP
jgi:hypothetical protein